MYIILYVYIYIYICIMYVCHPISVIDSSAGTGTQVWTWNMPYVLPFLFDLIVTENKSQCC